MLWAVLLIIGMWAAVVALGRAHRNGTLPSYPLTPWALVVVAILIGGGLIGLVTR